MNQEEFHAENETTDAGKDTFFAQTDAAPAAPERQGMSRNARYLLLSVCVLVVLGAALLILMLVHGNPAEPEPDAEAIASALLDEEDKAILINAEVAEDVTEIRISHRNADTAEPETFRVYRQAEATETEKAVYAIEGLEDVSLDTGLISTLVNNASSLSANRLVEAEAADLQRYGLDDPAAQVTLHYADGENFTFSVGDVSPLDDMETYCAVNQDVYLIKSSLMANYQKPMLSFVSDVMIEKPEETPVIESMEITRENLSYPITIAYAHELEADDSVGGNAATHKLLSPVNVYLSTEKSSDILDGIFGLTAAEIVQVHPTEADYRAAGMDAPCCTVSLTCADGTAYTLTFGKQYTTASDTAAYYACVEGMPVLYGVSEARAVWTSVLPGDIHAANIFNTYVWDIATLDVTGMERELHFSGTGTSSEDYTVTEHDQPCDSERFRLFYRFLLNIYGDELFFETTLPDTAPDVEIHLTTQDGTEDYTVAFYRLTDLNALIAVNGIPTYKTRTSCIETIRHNLSVFDDAEAAFILTWQ